MRGTNTAVNYENIEWRRKGKEDAQNQKNGEIATTSSSAAAPVENVAGPSMVLCKPHQAFASTPAAVTLLQNPILQPVIQIAEENDQQHS